MADYIQKRVASLKATIDRCQRQIQQYQEGCSHPESHVVKTHHGDTGNYDPTQDHYWTQFHCEICQKTWTQEG